MSSIEGVSEVDFEIHLTPRGFSTVLPSCCVYHQEAQPVPLHKTLVFSPCAGIEVATDVLLWAFSPSPDPMQHQTPRDHHPPQHRRHGAPGVL